MKASPLLRVEGLIKRFGGFYALQDVNIEIAPGERVGLIGPNGSGKSTFVGCVGGSIKPGVGRVSFDGRRIDRLSSHERVRAGLARSSQLPRPFHSLTVIENLYAPLHFATSGGRDAKRLVAERSISVALSPKSAAQPSDLTQVDLRKLDLARAMVANPRLLFVDEAMAGLSNSEVDETLGLLMRMRARGVAIVMIEHIMRAVMSFSQRIVVLVAGRKVADGAPAEVIADVEAQRAYLGE